MGCNSERLFLCDELAIYNLEMLKSLYCSPITNGNLYYGESVIILPPRDRQTIEVEADQHSIRKPHKKKTYNDS